MNYDLFKLIHIVAVVLFLGNITTGLFWIRHAMRSNSPALLAHAMDGVIRSDRLFTMPGVFVIIGFGVAATMAGGLSLLGTKWILTSIVLFGVSGAVFGALAPMQKRIHAYAAGANADWATCVAMVRKWELVGWFSLAPAWLALAPMVLKIPR